MLSFSKNNRYRIAVEKWSINIASLWKLTTIEVYSFPSLWGELLCIPPFVDNGAIAPGELFVILTLGVYFPQIAPFVDAILHNANSKKG